MFDLRDTGNRWCGPHWAVFGISRLCQREDFSGTGDFALQHLPKKVNNISVLWKAILNIANMREALGGCGTVPNPARELPGHSPTPCYEAFCNPSQIFSLCLPLCQELHCAVGPCASSLTVHSLLTYTYTRENWLGVHSGDCRMFLCMVLYVLYLIRRVCLHRFGSRCLRSCRCRLTASRGGSLLVML